MRLVWKLVKILGLVVVVLVVAVAGLLASAFAGHASLKDGARVGGVEEVKDGMVSAYLVDLGPGEVALVDAGNDRAGGPLLAALKRRGLGPDAVRAVLLTHGDSDHTAGAQLFPKATVMALGPDVALAEGRAVRMPLRRPHPTGLKVGRVLEDGEVLEYGATRIEVFALPGHTPGSAAYLAHGVLFLGDSAEVTSKHTLAPAMWLFCTDRPLNRASLRALGARLAPRQAEIKALACAHSGFLEQGPAALQAIAAR